VERATNMDREHWEYYLEETWRWLIASTPPPPPHPTPPTHPP